MADVEMTDAGPAAGSKAKSTAKVAKTAAADSGSDGKKKFEVKKASSVRPTKDHLQPKNAQWHGESAM
ncbi:MAG: hypothetical protein Q9160_002385 [Pyrenula sp. 1 TL-2023]